MAFVSSYRGEARKGEEKGGGEVVRFVGHYWFVHGLCWGYGLGIVNGFSIRRLSLSIFYLNLLIWDGYTKRGISFNSCLLSCPDFRKQIVTQAPNNLAKI